MISAGSQARGLRPTSTAAIRGCSGDNCGHDNDGCLSTRWVGRRSALRTAAAGAGPGEHHVHKALVAVVAVVPVEDLLATRGLRMAAHARRGQAAPLGSQRRETTAPRTSQNERERVRARECAGEILNVVARETSQSVSQAFLLPQDARADLESHVMGRCRPSNSRCSQPSLPHSRICVCFPPSTQSELAAALRQRHGRDNSNRHCEKTRRKAEKEAAFDSVPFAGCCCALTVPGVQGPK